MNMQRMLVLGLAAIAAGAAALIVRGFLGGGTPKVQAILAPPPVAMTDVLVASGNLQPGEHLTGAQVRWEPWPRHSTDSSFITGANNQSPDALIAGTVVRAPMVAGEPVTNAKIVHTDAAGILAASVTPGMRAMAITVAAETSAGGFILPNDRVDVIATIQTSEQPKRFKSGTLLENIRVLAMDQTYQQEANQKVVVARTATLEVSPEQADLIAAATATGTLSLALRGLADSTASALADSALGPSQNSPPTINVMRYGLPRAGGEAKGE